MDPDLSLSGVAAATDRPGRGCEGASRDPGLTGRRPCRPSDPAGRLEAPPMPPNPPPKKSPQQPAGAPAAPGRPAAQVPSPRPVTAPVPPIVPAPSTSGELGLGIAVNADASGVVTARRAGGLRDMALDVDPQRVGVKAALQHLAKAVNIAFQTDYGE